MGTAQNSREHVLIVQGATDEHTTQAHLGHAAFMGHRSRTGDFRGVLRLELWLGRGRNLGFLVTSLMVATMYTCFIFSSPS
ncbi:hypothetical protein BME99_22465 [Pseudomonas protegens]|nr:hypothetical protein BME99_22465 [Pseudomonas protegens]